jgi:HEXXH motif-containing protein
VDHHEFDVGDNAEKLERDPDACDLVGDQLRSARELIGAVAPDIATLVDAEANYVIPLQRAARHLSFSLSQLPHAVFIGGGVTPWPVVEAIVHEVAHLRLNHAAQASPLTADRRTPVCYSPWRDDPRPSEGLLHGTYAFTLVQAFWRLALEARPKDPGDAGIAYATERVATLRVQLEHAHEVLAQCDLSPFGERVAAGLRTALPRIEDLRLGPAIVARARKAADQHRRDSRASFPHLIAPAARGA